MKNGKSDKAELAENDGFIGEEVNCVIRIRSIYRGGFEFRISTETTGEECIRDALQKISVPDEAVNYFGFQFEIFGETLWIDNSKSIHAQLTATVLPGNNPKGKRLFAILLRKRFYGLPDYLLDNDTLRTFLYYQLKSDFIEGKLTKSVPEIVTLAAYLLHVASLTLISHTMPGLDFERKLASVLPNNILSYKTLAPYVKAAMNVISSLTIEQTKMRFICQCQNLSKYGAEKFSAVELSSRSSSFIYVSCRGIIVCAHHKPRVFKDWAEVSHISCSNDITNIETDSHSKRHIIQLLFGTPEKANAACQSMLLQRTMAQRWVKPNIHFQPLVSVPRNLLQFDGESEKLTEAIQTVFASSQDNIYMRGLMSARDHADKNGRSIFLSEANIYSRVDSPFTMTETDAFSLPPCSEESTLPLIYGSLLAQSTPILRHHSSVRAISRSNCVSAINLPHKKRLAASRPLVNCNDMIDHAASLGMFDSQQSINGIERMTNSTQGLLVNNYSIEKCSENVSGARKFDVSFYGYENKAVEFAPVSKCTLGRSVSSRIPAEVMESEDEFALLNKYKSESVLGQKESVQIPESLGEESLTGSTEDLTMLSGDTQANTLPSTFKRRGIQKMKLPNLSVLQKMKIFNDADQEYKALPLFNKTSGDADSIFNQDQSVEYTISSGFSLEIAKSEEFWENAPSFNVILNAQSLIEDVNTANDGVVSIFHADAVTGDHVAVGKETFLSLFYKNHTSSCKMFGIHVKFAATSPHHFFSKTVWFFCWTGDITIENVTSFESFVDEVVAAELSQPSAKSTISVSSMKMEPNSCLLFVLAHSVLRILRQSKSSELQSKTIIFDAVSALRCQLNASVVSLENYKLLHELLKQWLKKPPSLI